jgi:hypothetical protein
MKKLHDDQLNKVNGGAIFLIPVIKAVFTLGSGMIGAYSLGKAIGRKL